MAKGGSILLVVLFHAAIAFERHDLVSPAWWRVNDLVAPIRMPLFFLVSGALTAKLLGLGWRDFLVRRELPVVYALLVWSAIHLVAIALIWGADLPSAGRFLAIPVEPVSVIWFLWALAIYALVGRTVPAALRSLAFALALGLALASHLGAVSFESFVHDNLARFLAFYLFGAWYAGTTLRLVDARAARVLAPAAIAYVALFHGGDRLPPPLAAATGLVLSVLGVLVGLSTSKVLERVGPLRSGLSYLGRNTLPIYVVHMLALEALAAVLHPTLGTGTPSRLLIVPAFAAIAIAIGLALERATRAAGARWLFAPPAVLARRLPSGA